MNNYLTENPERDTFLSQGLDYYKATMSQVEYEKHPDTIVTFEMKNRGKNRLSEYVSPTELEARLAELEKGWSPEEIAYLASLQNQDGKGQFSEEFLDYLIDNPLPPIDISLDDAGELAVQTTGPWPLVTFWETVAMSEINEIYFANKLNSEGKDLDDLYREGDRRLDEKIARLKARPDIKFSDFGTRRRFSYDWQEHVVTRIATELPDNFLGTSNIFLAHKLGLKPIGTFAHELLMVYAALEDKAGNDPLTGQRKVFQDWNEVYRGDLSTALTDTFTTPFFFADFTPEQARAWKSLRHDSGDPFDFGDEVIEFYESLGINPLEKTIVFSDNLDIDKIFELADYFQGKINIIFGWGTTLMNDLGIETNNFVMKAVRADGQDAVKLSDAKGKHTGNEADVVRYESFAERHIAARALRKTVVLSPERQLVAA